MSGEWKSVNSLRQIFVVLKFVNSSCYEHYAAYVPSLVKCDAVSEAHDSMWYYYRLGPMDIEPKVRQAQAPRAKRARPTETARAEEVHVFLE